MSRRAKIVIGLALLVAILQVLLWVRGEQSSAQEPDGASTKTEAAPTTSRVRPRPAAVEVAVAEVEDLEDVETEVERRDHTGELLSDGPAQPITLPEAPEGAGDNVPSASETEQATASVIARLEAEIAAAQAIGDTAEAQRLEVRRARLERKLEE